MNKYHDIYFTHDPKRESAWIAITKYIQRFIPITSVVLDLGAGYCNFINHVVARERYAIDAWDGFKKYASKNVITSVSDLSKGLPKIKNKIDVAFASNLLEHLTIESASLLLANIYDALSKNGVLIIIQPNFGYSYKNYFDDYTHKTVFTHVSLSNLLVSKGFSIVYMDPKFLPLSLKNSFPIAPFIVSLYLMLPFKIFGGQMLLVAKKSDEKQKK